MITKTAIVNAARKLSKGKRGTYDRALTHPRRDWYIGIGVAIVFAMLGMGANAYVFSYFSNVETKVVPNEAPAVTYDVALVERILSADTERRTRFMEILGTLPSLPEIATSSPEIGEESAASPAPTAGAPVSE
jgi:hypothetical protein